jgi:low temperature requirement protein LtrA
MSQAEKQPVKEEVSPLELFFDLVFVFALSQLSHHLLDNLTWRGAAETLVLLVAVFTVWSYTSFEATLLQVSRKQTRWVMLAVMLLGLFMNASISRAWAGGAWWFVAPFLISQLGHGITTTISAPSRMLREHYAIMLGWIVASAPLWLIGAAAEETTRLWWWAAAAAIDLIGTWFAHPVPGRVLHSRNVAFDADHMIERCRLFLIIALGETVLTTGTALAQAPFGVLTAVTGSLSLLSIVSLWVLYFGGSDRLVSEHVASTADPIRTARLAMNSEVVVVAGLIALAVGQEVVIAHPLGHASVALSLLLFGGPLLYLLAQAWYLHVVSGRLPGLRLAGAGALILGGAVSLLISPYAALALLAGLLAALAATSLREVRTRPEAEVLA